MFGVDFDEIWFFFGVVLVDYFDCLVVVVGVCIGDGDVVLRIVDFVKLSEFDFYSYD